MPKRNRGGNSGTSNTSFSSFDTGAKAYDFFGINVFGASSNVPAAGSAGGVLEYNNEVGFFSVSSGMYSDWASNTNNDEKGAIVKYTGSYYSVINGKLRAGSAITGKDKENMKKLDSAISKFELTKPIITYRGSSAAMLGGLTNPNDINRVYKGKKLEDKAYVSSSAVKGSNFSGQILYEIHVKPGKGKGAFIAPISNFANENEFLFARGSSFTVKGARYNSQGQTVVTLEI